MVPVVKPTWSPVVHIKTMHAFAEPESVAPLAAAGTRMRSLGVVRKVTG
jgi:hypothetical protein